MKSSNELKIQIVLYIPFFKFIEDIFKWIMDTTAAGA